MPVHRGDCHAPMPACVPACRKVNDGRNHQVNADPVLVSGQASSRSGGDKTQGEAAGRTPRSWRRSPLVDAMWARSFNCAGRKAHCRA